jgi:hypothetical protein
MPIKFCRQSATNALRIAVSCPATYLGDVNENHQVIVLQIHGMLRTDSVGNGLDNSVSVEL